MERIIIVLAVLAVSTGCSKTKSLPTDVIMVGDKKVTIEIARNAEDRTQGLSDRKSLAEDRGMLFVFARPGPMTFWMFHCHFDIDLAYIAPDGTIREIMTMRAEPYDTSPEKLVRYPSRAQDIKYALEMNGGWFGRNGVEPGETLDLERFEALY